MTSEQGRAYYQQLRRNQAFGAAGFDLAGLRAGMAARRDPVDPDVVCIPGTIDDMHCEWVLAPGAEPDLRLLYLHGGGHVSGSGAFYLAMAARISAAAGCAVFLPDYRLAPEHPYPAALEDCLRAYDWVRAHGPSGEARAASRVFVGGDSAGGNLALALLLALRDRGLPLPAGGIALSPFADLTLSSESIRTQAETDPIMHPNALPHFTALYLGGADAREPLISPVFGDYRGLPPLLIQAGEYEIILDDSLRTAERARSCGVRVQLEVYPGMFHVFQSHEPPLPEALEAFASIGAFIRQAGG